MSFSAQLRFSAELSWAVQDDSGALVRHACRTRAAIGYPSQSSVAVNVSDESEPLDLAARQNVIPHDFPARNHW